MHFTPGLLQEYRMKTAYIKLALFMTAMLCGQQVAASQESKTTSAEAKATEASNPGLERINKIIDRVSILRWIKEQIFSQAESIDADWPNPYLNLIITNYLSSLYDIQELDKDGQRELKEMIEYLHKEAYFTDPHFFTECKYCLSASVLDKVLVIIPADDAASLADQVSQIDGKTDKEIALKAIAEAWLKNKGDKEKNKDQKENAPLAQPASSAQGSTTTTSSTTTTQGQV